MVAIRLTRTGAKKKPSYRVIVTDKRRARDSKTLEIVGHYNPRLDPIELKLQRERIGYWLGVGAQPSDTVKRLIKYFDEHGENLVQPKRKAMQEAAAAAPLVARPEPKPTEEEKPEAKAEEPEVKADSETKTEEAPAEKPKEEPKAEAAPSEEAAAAPAEEKVEAKADEAEAEPAVEEEAKKPEADA